MCVRVVVGVLLALQPLEVGLFDCVSLSCLSCCVVMCLLNLDDLLGGWASIWLVVFDVLLVWVGVLVGIEILLGCSLDFVEWVFLLGSSC